MAAFGIVHRFRGGTKEQYDASIAIVHPADGSLPAGQTYHVAGPTDDGWIIVAMWDSRESWQRFRDETLFPGFESMAGSGLPVPPEETTFEVQNEQEG